MDGFYLDLSFLNATVHGASGDNNYDSQETDGSFVVDPSGSTFASFDPTYDPYAVPSGGFTTVDPTQLHGSYIPVALHPPAAYNAWADPVSAPSYTSLFAHNWGNGAPGAFAAGFPVPDPSYAFSFEASHPFAPQPHAPPPGYDGPSSTSTPELSSTSFSSPSSASLDTPPAPIPAPMPSTSSSSSRKRTRSSTASKQTIPYAQQSKGGLGLQADHPFHSHASSSSSVAGPSRDPSSESPSAVRPIRSLRSTARPCPVSPQDDLNSDDDYEDTDCEDAPSPSKQAKNSLPERTAPRFTAHTIAQFNSFLSSFLSSHKDCTMFHCPCLQCVRAKPMLLDSLHRHLYRADSKRGHFSEISRRLVQDKAVTWEELAFCVCVAQTLGFQREVRTIAEDGEDHVHTNLLQLTPEQVTALSLFNGRVSSLVDAASFDEEVTGALEVLKAVVIEIVQGRRCKFSKCALKYHGRIYDWVQGHKCSKDPLFKKSKKKRAAKSEADSQDKPPFKKAKTNKSK